MHSLFLASASCTPIYGLAVLKHIYHKMAALTFKTIFYLYLLEFVIPRKVLGSIFFVIYICSVTLLKLHNIEKHFYRYTHKGQNGISFSEKILMTRKLVMWKQHWNTSVLKLIFVPPNFDPHSKLVVKKLQFSHFYLFIFFTKEV